MFSLSWSAASFLAPIIGGAVLQYAGAAALWLGCFGLATVVVAGIHLLAGPARERRAAQLPGRGWTGAARHHLTSIARPPAKLPSAESLAPSG